MDFVKTTFDKLSDFELKNNQIFLIVKIDKQKLFICKNTEIIKEYNISTGYKGIGNKKGSYKTPLGSHKIFSKHGDGEPIGTIFDMRKSLGIVTKILTQPVSVPQGFVTTRILRLEGLEEGINKGGNVDTFDRLIYIHGTQEEGNIGKPASKGCIRMINSEIIDLYKIVEVNTLVEILK
ncbi:MAG: L,D-transpeptidase [Candidatus Cloacimonadota bacterium]|nr:L,D-transpeptidase [Candidatus Cloacimonadota bacterium]